MYYLTHANLKMIRLFKEQASTQTSEFSHKGTDCLKMKFALVTNPLFNLIMYFALTSLVSSTSTSKTGAHCFTASSKAQEIR